MLPAGAATEDTLAELLPMLSSGDTLVDGGNAYYKDSMARRPGDVAARAALHRRRRIRAASTSLPPPRVVKKEPMPPDTPAVDVARRAATSPGAPIDNPCNTAYAQPRTSVSPEREHRAATPRCRGLVLSCAARAPAAYQEDLGGTTLAG